MRFDSSAVYTAGLFVSILHTFSLEKLDAVVHVNVKLSNDFKGTLLFLKVQKMVALIDTRTKMFGIIFLMKINAHLMFNENNS